MCKDPSHSFPDPRLAITQSSGGRYCASGQAQVRTGAGTGAVFWSGSPQCLSQQGWDLLLGLNWALERLLHQVWLNSRKEMNPDWLGCFSLIFIVHLNKGSIQCWPRRVKESGKRKEKYKVCEFSELQGAVKRNYVMYVLSMYVKNIAVLNIHGPSVFIL